ncbi:MAG: peptidoglycan DD-metalloendopeptidase family protein [Bacteroidales bacterium]|nr:peptidoglycan DD-metalloendopeptidase family protein [Bacteroidales bacterium]
MRLFLITTLSFLYIYSYSQNIADSTVAISYEIVEDTIAYDSMAYAISFNDRLEEFGYQNWQTNEVYYKHNEVLNTDDSIAITLVDSCKNECYSHPFQGAITSHFGYRRYRQHYGIDIDLITGDSVKVAFDGKVRVTKYTRGFGKLVVVRHKNGLETAYAHLSKILTDSNDCVKSGDIIGLGGNTGRSTGSHLHFEVRHLGRAMDPESIIDFDKAELLDDNILICDKNFDYLQRIANDKNAKFHYVKSGDNLSRIARRYKTRISKLCYYNGINQNAILQIGQKLRVR